MSALRPLPGRDCGDCAACCTDLAIDTPDLRKPDGEVCPHHAAGAGCGIYPTRPQVCRTWFCGWRIMSLSDGLRPDRSRVLLIPEVGDRPPYQKGGLRIAPLNGDRGAALHDEVIDLAARCIASDIPIFLSWGDGAHTKRFLANDALKPAVLAGDRHGFVAGLRGAFDGMAALVDAERAAPLLMDRKGRRTS